MFANVFKHACNMDINLCIMLVNHSSVLQHVKQCTVYISEDILSQYLKCNKIYSIFKQEVVLFD